MRTDLSSNVTKCFLPWELYHDKSIFYFFGKIIWIDLLPLVIASIGKAKDSQMNNICKCKADR